MTREPGRPGRAAYAREAERRGPGLAHAARGAIHQSVAAVTESVLDNCVIVGTPALAAWTALFAVAHQVRGDELSSTTRAMRLIGEHC
jgi:hypothetical protein